ncbi:unnamed protein product [Durusdinium trenchii]|uniref:Adaptor protein ClpS core domain-containing protein n=2 Tax=Durusdinium trenchii TaxID=1381693 RepID=A0ABP0LCJ3_9DINO
MSDMGGERYVARSLSGAHPRKRLQQPLHQTLTFVGPGSFHGRRRCILYFRSHLTAMATTFALSRHVPGYASVPPERCPCPASEVHRAATSFSFSARADGCLAGTVLLSACSRTAWRRTARRAVDLPVREPPVTTTVALPGAKVEEETKQKRADEYRLVLFNDPLNKREYVARCLMTICLLKEGDAYQVMMKAHKEGVAVVGTYAFETAEAYCESLKAQGLSVDIFPVDKDD